MPSANDNLYTSRGFAPLREELDVDALSIEGDWPTGLHGSLYRIGPNPQFEPRPPYNPLLGDGMVHVFHLHAGRVCYRNRWVRTRQWTLEREAARALFATSGDPRDHDASVTGLLTDGVANTNVIWHGRRLLALEEGHAPIELDPHTLDTLGTWTFDGALPGNMTAHPKLDPLTGELVFFASEPERRFDGSVAWYVADAAGTLIRSGRFRAPFPALIHDFAVTRDFLVFPFCPITISVSRAMAGGPALAWEPDKRTHVAVIRRDGSGEPRWFNSEPCFAWHIVNARNDEHVITLDLCQQSQPALPFPDGSPTDPTRHVQHLTRWRIDSSSSASVDHRRLCDQACEYPRCDERFMMGAVRHSYFTCHGGPGTGDLFHRGIAHFDHGRNHMITAHLGATSAVSEPIFVPRSNDTPEGDGFLLCVAYEERDDRSALLVFDARDIAAGPLGRAQLHHRVPMGFHGCWRPAEPSVMSVA